jgi:hypothetical protein
MRGILPFAIELAADFSGSGTFTPVGVIERPPRAAQTAMEELRAFRGGNAPAALVHMLATSIAGRCRLAATAPLAVLASCREAALVLEWKLHARRVGSLRALFAIARWVVVGEGCAEVALRLAGIPILALRCDKKFDGGG